MNFYSPCEVCKKRRFFVRRRTYTFPAPIGKITSKAEMCHKCSQVVPKMLQ